MLMEGSDVAALEIRVSVVPETAEIYKNQDVVNRRSPWRRTVAGGARNFSRRRWTGYIDKSF
jgi:hypothetical protein